MFGTLRFLLALLVVGCHTDWEFNPTEVTAGGALDLGSVSVIIFFILSGYVMTASVRRYYAQRKQYIGFIFDRVCRIFPQYILWLLLTLLWIQLNSPGAKPIGTRPILENLVLLPLMFSVWDCQPLLTRVYYIGQAWSLSLELFFYLLLPVLLWSDRLRKTAFLLSLLVFALATFNVINPNVYSYHLLPGVLFIFLLGGMTYDEISAAEFAGTRLLTPYIFVAVLAMAGNALRTLHHHWTPEVLVGILTGVPLVAWLARRPTNPVDDWLGNLSYGIFLNHYVVINILLKYQIATDRWSAFFITALGAILLAIPAYYILERPVARLRRGLRRKLHPVTTPVV